MDQTLTAATDYKTCAETAQLVRATLKKQWPCIKFSVRSKTYSGGASIRIHWTDGPLESAVKAIVYPFEGATFDGMIDLKTSVYAVYNGRRTNFGSDYIFMNRQITDEDELIKLAHAHVIASCVFRDGLFGNYSPTEMARRVVHQIDFTDCTIRLEDRIGRAFENLLGRRQ